MSTSYANPRSAVPRFVAALLRASVLLLLAPTPVLHAQSEKLASPAPRRLPLVPEAPPAHPPAAACGPCSAGCGSAPRPLPDVYLHSGEFHHREVDLVIPGRGMDFRWTRTYRSRLGRQTAQGHGWTHGYDLRIEAETAGVRVLDGAGRRDLLKKGADDTYTRRELFRQGAFAPDGRFVLTFKDGGTWTFLPLDGSPAEGRVEQITDRNGNVIAFEYDPAGRLTGVVDTLGRTVQVLYRTDGMIDSIVDFVGRSVKYDYYSPTELGGSAGDLKSARSPLVTGTPNGNDFPAGKTTTYTYSRGTGSPRLDHNLLTITDPGGNTWLVNEYAATTDETHLRFDRLVRQTRGDPGDVIDIHYSLGFLPDWPCATEPACRLIPGVLAIVNDRVGNVSDQFFDLRGRCLRLRELTGRADPDLVTTPTANRPANPLGGVVSVPPAYTTRWAYNADSLPVLIRRPGGNLTRNVFERALTPGATARVRGNLRERHRTPGTYLPAGDQLVLTESFEYDVDLGGCCGSNFVTRHVDARGNVTEHDYDARGNRIQTRHRLDAIVEDFTYDAFGQMTSHVHPDNGSGWRRTDAWTYYASGPQRGYVEKEVVDANGLALTTTFAYDAVGNPVQTTDPRGNTTIQVFNALAQEVLRISPKVALHDGTLVQYEVETFYDEDDNIVRVDTMNVDVDGALGANTHFSTTYSYEALDRVTRMTREVSAGVDVVEEYEYDANRNRTLVRKGEAVNGNQPTNVVRLLYDERDLVYRRIVAEGDPLQTTTEVGYDLNGDAVLVRSGVEGPSPREQRTTLDAYGRMLTSEDSMGNRTSYEYDPNGNMTATRVLGELCDVPGSDANVRLFEASYTYDAMDRLVDARLQHFDPATQAPVGDGESLSSFAWTPASQVARATDDNGNATVFVYDSAGRLSLLTDAASNSRRWEYDENGNVTRLVEEEHSDGSGSTTSFTTDFLYDSVDRVVAEFDPVGSQVVWGYDSQDAPALIVDALGNRTLRTFDGLSRMTSSSRFMTDTGTGAGGVIGMLSRAWSWDDDSRLVAVTDPNGNKTTYTYDALDRLVGEARADGTTESYVHDVHGNVTERTDANGTVVDTTYDLSNRLASRSITPAAGVSSDTTYEVWKHDGMSRLVHAEDDDTTVVQAWDSLGNRLAEDQDGKVLRASHDGVGNEVAVVYPGGKTLSRTFDGLGRVTGIDNAGPTSRYGYVGPQRLESRTTGANVVVTTYAYDAARRVSSIDHRVGTTLLDQRTYAWDGMYNKVRMVDVLGSGEQHEYAYDSQYRLVQSRLESAMGALLDQVDYQLDPVGNRVTVTGGSCSGPYGMDGTTPEPADQQMNQYTSTPCIGCIEYDANGDELLRQGQSATLRDYAGRIVEYSDAAGRTTYTYDALGRRRSAAGPGGTLAFYYDGWEVVEERDGADAVVAINVHGPDGLVERTPTASSIGCYILPDDQGNVRVVTDPAGTPLERYEYDDYGAPTFLSPTGAVLPGSAIGNPWLYNGQYYDAESGYYYYRARHLDPLTGRFLGRDPLGLWGDPGNLGSGSAYVGNNPHTMVDPTGMFAARTNCGRAWPGPSTVYYERIDCGLDQRLPTALCTAMGGARRARRDLLRWWSLELGRPATSFNEKVGRLTARRIFTAWFGGPDGVVRPEEIGRIMLTIMGIWEPFRIGREIPMECESGCSNANAYVASYDSSLHLCPSWWGMSRTQRGAIVLHEMAHGYAGLDQDTFYNRTTSPTGAIRIPGIDIFPWNPFETSVLSANADTYEMLYLTSFVR